MTHSTYRCARYVLARGGLTLGSWLGRPCLFVLGVGAGEARSPFVKTRYAHGSSVRCFSFGFATVFHKPVNEGAHVHAKRVAYLPQLDKVKSPLAALVVAYRRLKCAQAGGDLNLRQVCFLPHKPQQVLQQFGSRAVDTLPHAPILVLPFLILELMIRTIAPRRKIPATAAIELPCLWALTGGNFMRLLSLPAVLGIAFTALALAGCGQSEQTGKNPSAPEAPTDPALKVAEEEASAADTIVSDSPSRAAARKVAEKYARTRFGDWSVEGMATEAVSGNLIFVGVDLSHRQNKRKTINLVVRRFYKPDATAYWMAESVNPQTAALVERKMVDKELLESYLDGSIYGVQEDR